MGKGINPETGKGCRFKDRTGERNGRLTFIKYLGESVHRHSRWEAICDCGNTTVTTTPRKTQSCGCLQKETVAQAARNRALPPDVRRKNKLKNRSAQRLKRKLDPVKAMHSRLSRLHRHALAQVNAIKKSPTLEQLGYTAEGFAAHIERQFVRGMGWHNMSEWQIDHIVPISESKTEDDVVALNQLSNLRPLWKDLNNKKKNQRQTLL